MSFNLNKLDYIERTENDLYELDLYEYPVRLYKNPHISTATITSNAIGYYRRNYEESVIRPHSEFTKTFIHGGLAQLHKKLSGILDMHDMGFKTK